jgi:hypothetical protein
MFDLFQDLAGFKNLQGLFSLKGSAFGDGIDRINLNNCSVLVTSKKTLVSTSEAAKR